MKHRLLLLLSALALLASCSNQQGEWTSQINDFEALKAQFANPSQEFGTAPLWVWNTKITEDIIDSSLKDLKNKGFGGVFVHPRPGLVTEYLSDEWFALYRHTIEQGKKLGLDVWIYDENSYPSGFAGGHVPAEMPESYNQGQSLKIQKFTALPDTLPNDIFIWLKKENDSYVDVTETIANQSRTDSAEYFAFRKGYYDRSPWYGGYSYVDLIMPGVTEKFIEITMDAYKREFGEEFGRAIKGWFTDEPHIAPPGGIRWTPDLFDVFEQRWGYDLKLHLPSLFEETGDWQRIRHNYTQTLLTLFIERWAKPCFDYCEKHNLKFTGHYWEHEYPQLTMGQDNMAMYAHHQQPAVDMLFNQYNDENPQAQFGNVRSIKELRSVANQMGFNRTLSETYGGGGWDETFRDFKRLGDWEFALGVNFMNQHIADLSIAGARKYDYPPVFSAVEPWWNNYRTLNLYFARLSMALSAGEQRNDILVFEPTTTLWLYYSQAKRSPKVWEIGKTFQTFVTTIEKQQTEYDLASEDIVKSHGRVEDGKLIVGHRAYSVAVIPPMIENLDAVSFKLLKQFAANGGKIISYSKPEFIDGQKNTELIEFFEKIKTEQIDAYPFKNDKISFNIESGDDLYHQRREMKDGQTVFLVNSSLTETAKGKFLIDGKSVAELQALTGEIFDYPAITQANKLEIAYEIPPAGSLLLYVLKNDRQLDIRQSGIRKADRTVTDADMKIKPLDLNALTIDFCDLTTGGETVRDMHIFDAADRAFKVHDFTDGNPWNTSVQYKNSTLARDTFQTGGFTADYHFFVADNFDYSGIKAVVERSHLYTVKINGTEVKATGEKWIDPEMDIISIGKYVKRGKNTVSLTVTPFKIMAEAEQVVILGDFRVVPAKKGFQIVAPADEFTAEWWKNQGYPFYSKSFSYAKTFNVSDTTVRYAVHLGEWRGTVAEVFANGQSAGIIGFEPYEIDITDFVQSGENTVEVRVAGSNQNLFGPFHGKRQDGLVSPWDFRNVKYYPSGNEYRQFDYGLKGFEVAY